MSIDVIEYGEKLRKLAKKGTSYILPQNLDDSMFNAIHQSLAKITSGEYENEEGDCMYLPLLYIIIIQSLRGYSDIKCSCDGMMKSFQKLHMIFLFLAFDKDDDICSDLVLDSILEGTEFERPDSVQIECPDDERYQYSILPKLFDSI